MLVMQEGWAVGRTLSLLCSSDGSDKRGAAPQDCPVLGRAALGSAPIECKKRGRGSFPKGERLSFLLCSQTKAGHLWSHAHMYLFQEGLLDNSSQASVQSVCAVRHCGPACQSRRLANTAVPQAGLQISPRAVPGSRETAPVMATPPHSPADSPATPAASAPRCVWRQE